MRLYKHLLVLKYTRDPLEVRRIFHFLVQAIGDDNHRQNAAIQYYQVRQTSGHMFEYFWLNIVRNTPSPATKTIKSAIATPLLVKCAHDKHRRNPLQFFCNLCGL